MNQDKFTLTNLVVRSDYVLVEVSSAGNARVGEFNSVVREAFTFDCSVHSMDDNSTMEEVASNFSMNCGT